MTTARRFRYVRARGERSQGTMQSPATPRFAVTPPTLVPLIWNQLAAPSGLEPWNGFPASHVDGALRRLRAFDTNSLHAGLRLYVACRSSSARGSDGSHGSPSDWATFMERRR